MGTPGRPTIGTLEMGAQVNGVTRIDTQGPLKFTGNHLDLALIGDGPLHGGHAQRAPVHPRRLVLARRDAAAW